MSDNTVLPLAAAKFLKHVAYALLFPYRYLKAMFSHSFMEIDFEKKEL
jgi:hypothetical protein